MDFFAKTLKILGLKDFYKKRTITKMILSLINYFVPLTNCSDLHHDCINRATNND